MVTPHETARLRDWPEDRKQLYIAVVLGWADGDLAPLAKYITAGHPVDRFLAHMIADAIDGMPWEERRLKLVGKQGQKKYSTLREKMRERVRIGLYIERRIEAYGYDAGVAAGMEKFDIGDTKAEGDLKFLRDLRASNKVSDAELIEGVMLAFPEE